MNEVLLKTQEIIEDYLGGSQLVTAEMDLVTDLGLNSFDMASLLCEFEDQFDLEISTEAAVNITTVQSIADYIEKSLKTVAV